MTRVGLITPTWPGTRTANGITTAVYHLAHGFRDIGQDVVILPFASDGAAGEFPVFPVEQRTWSVSEKLRYRLERITGDARVVDEILAMQIAEAVREAQRCYGLDVVVMEETYGWSAHLQKRLGIPVVVTLHGPWFLLKKLQGTGTDRADRIRQRNEAVAILAADGISAPSEDVLTATQEQMPLRADVPKMVLRNPIPLGMGHVGTTLDRGESNKLLFVGRFDRLKGGDTVIAAFDVLARSNEAACLTFVGPDRGVERVDGTRVQIDAALFALEPSVRTRVQYLGQRSTIEIEELRRGHAVTMIASRYETLCYTMLEAMAQGSALVATNVGGPAEVLRHEETALLVPPDDPVAMAAACARLLDSPDLRFRLGRAAQEVIRKEFQPEAVARQWVGFLDDVIARYDHVRRKKT